MMVSSRIESSSKFSARFAPFSGRHGRNGRLVFARSSNDVRLTHFFCLAAAWPGNFTKNVLGFRRDRSDKISDEVAWNAPRPSAKRSPARSWEFIAHGSARIRTEAVRRTIRSQFRGYFSANVAAAGGNRG